MDVRGVLRHTKVCLFWSKSSLNKRPHGHGFCLEDKTGSTLPLATQRRKLTLGCAMPITYMIDVPRALIVTMCFGAVTVAEVQEHFEELARVWPPVDRLDVLLDLTHQTSLPALPDLEKVATEIDAQIGLR